MIVVFGTHFHFFKILIFQVFRGDKKEKKMTHNYQFQSGWNKMCAQSESCMGCACNCLKSAQ